MKKLLLPLGLAFLACDLGASPVDLTPRYVDTFIDGIKCRRLYFVEDAKKIGVSLDRETEVAPDPSGGVLFRFSKFPDASFRMAYSPLTPAEPMSEAALDRYRAAAQTFVPVGAIEVKVTAETANPLPINRWSSYRFAVSYQVGAAAQRQTVTFLNLNAESQVVLITGASPKNFPEAAERSFQIIRSWQELLPGDEFQSKGN